MRLEPISIENSALERYVALFRRCFEGNEKFSRKYLEWLYVDNPAGRVTGFDAYDGDNLAGHYACIPAFTENSGNIDRSLLSLNTAVSPDYQGQGLFTKLADKTYEAAEDEGFACVFGVANANSTPGFTGKLGFELVAPLEAKLGLRSLGVAWDYCSTHTDFRRHWDAESLLWRSRNPSNPMAISPTHYGTLSMSAPAAYPFVHAYCELENSCELEVGSQNLAAGIRLFIGMFPKGSCDYSGYFDIPNRLRPSPLNLIYKSLNSKIKSLDPDRILMGFHDFDAY